MEAPGRLPLQPRGPPAGPHSGVPGTACSLSSLPFCPRWNWAPLGALNVNSPLLPQLQTAPTPGCPYPPTILPPQTRPARAGPRWELSLEAGFVCEVHLQGWERLLKAGGRPRLGVPGRRGEEKPLEGNSKKTVLFYKFQGSEHSPTFSKSTIFFCRL